MDLRIQKTRRAIKNAFLGLLSEKELKQITVKELCQAAQISKGTFYLHYRDLFDLRDRLHQDLVRRILSHMADPMAVLTDVSGFLEALQRASDAENEELISLFSGSQQLLFPVVLERELKAWLFAAHPEYENDAQMNVWLSYHIFGAYYAYMENSARFGQKEVLQVIRRTRNAHSGNG